MQKAEENDMKKTANHIHGAALYATVRRDGKYNLYEKNLDYGHPQRKIAEDLTMDELLAWRDAEYKGLQALPEITLRSVTGRVLIPHRIVRAAQ